MKVKNPVGALEAGRVASVIYLKRDPAAAARVIQDSVRLAAIIEHLKKVKVNGDGSEETQLTFQEAVG